MNRFFNKIISGFEILLLLFSCVITIVVSCANTANAAPNQEIISNITSTKQWINTAKRVGVRSSITGKTTYYQDDVKIFVDKNLVVNNGAYITNPNESTAFLQYVYIDDGATFNAILYDNPEKDKVTKDDWYMEVWANDQFIAGPYSTVTDLKIKWDDVKKYVDYTDPVIYIKVYKSNGEHFWHIGGNTQTNIIPLKINHNSILLDGSNKGISQNHLECDNAVIYNNTLYIKPSSSIVLSNDWKINRACTSAEKSTGTGRYSCSNTTDFFITGNQFTVGNKIGAKGTIRFENNYGSTSTTMDVVISNLIGSTVEYDGAVKSANGKVGYNNTVYDRDMQIYAKENSNNEMKINFNRVYGNIAVNAVDAKLSISDVTGCLSDKSIKNSGKSSTISFTPKCSGIINISWKDYANVQQSRSIEVIAQKGEITPEKEQIKEEKTNPVVNPNENQQITDQEANNNQTSQTPIIIPEVEIENVVCNGTKRTFYITLDKCDTKKWAVLKDTEYVSSEHFYNKYSYNTVPGTKLTGNSVTIDAMDYQDGNYYFVAIGITGHTFSWYALGPFSLGPSSCIKKPEITCQKETSSTENCANYNFQIANCTNARYCIIPREKKSNGELAEFKMPTQEWSKFISNDSMKVYNASTPTNFTVPVSASIEKKSGYYDVIVFARNGSDEYVTYKNEGPVFVNTAPKIEMTENTQKRQSDYREYTVNITDTNENDNITEMYYYLNKKAQRGEYVQPAISEIVKNGVKIENKNNQIIKLEESGIYDIIVYAKDNNNTSTIIHNDNIVISKLPKITYTIEGENANSVFSTQTRDKQVINLTVTDQDVNDKISVKYFVSDEYLEKINTDTFSDKKYEVKDLMANVQSGENGKIEVTTDGEFAKKYVYMMATDQYGFNSIKTTGELDLDNSEFKLLYVYTDEKVNYSVDDEFNVYLQFNHPIKEQNAYPGIKIKINENEIIQNQATKVSDYILKYTYKITNESPNGYIKNIDFNYGANKFVDGYTKGNVYDKTIANDQNVKVIIPEKCNIDTIAPTVSKIEVKVDTEDDKSIDNGSDIIVGKYKKVTLDVEYSEPVVNEAPILKFKLGDKVSELASAASTGNEPRTKDTYYLNDWINILELQKFSGVLDIDGFFFVTKTKDVSGNYVDFKNCPEPIYVLNGTTIQNKKISFDNVIYQSVATNLGQKVGSKININEDTSIKYFAEFNKPEDYADISGLDNIEFKIYYKTNNALVMDREGNELTANTVTNSDDSKYSKIASYTLVEEQLPLEVKFENEGTFKTICKKSDRIGNADERTSEVQVSTLVALAKGLCQYEVENKDAMYNFLTLSKEQRKLDIYLLVDDEIDMDDYELIVYDGTQDQINATYVEDVSYTGLTFKKYTIDCKTSGIYKVKVVNSNDEAILEDYIEIYNVYTPGDVNYDGMINMLDVTCILRNIARFKFDSKYADYLTYTTDVNGDGITKIVDVTFLSRFVGEDPAMEITENGFIGLK